MAFSSVLLHSYSASVSIWSRFAVLIRHTLRIFWREELVYSSVALAGCSSLGLGLWLSYQVSQTPSWQYLPVEAEERQQLLQTNVSHDQSDATATAAGILVEVAGAVQKPGVFSLSTGGRVQDALYQAGGFLPEADLEYIHKQISLAAYVQDQQKIYIPFVGENQHESSVTAPSVAPNSSVVTKKELMTISGIGEVRAAQITAAAPFTSANDIAERAKISATLAEQVWELYVKE